MAESYSFINFALLGAIGSLYLIGAIAWNSTFGILVGVVTAIWFLMQ
jgi:hypothetical protein